MKYTKIAVTATIAVAALLLLAATALYASRVRSRVMPQAATVASEVVPTQRPASARIEVLLATPQAREYRQRQDFERRIKRFLAEAPRLGDVERSEQARTLAAAINDSARSAQMSAGEAFVLHAALIEASTHDSDDRIARMTQLAERYRHDAAQREARWLASQQRNPQFQDYKARERAIVAEVMTMPVVPSGLTRDTYLRQRLQEAREGSYR